MLRGVGGQGCLSEIPWELQSCLADPGLPGPQVALVTTTPQSLFQKFPFVFPLILEYILKNVR